MEEKRSIGAWVAVVLMVLLIPPVCYAAAYLLRGKRERDILGDYCRSFPTESESLFFVPASKVESAVTGKSVRTVSRD